jgi:hypothetical protein
MAGEPGICGGIPAPAVLRDRRSVYPSGERVDNIRRAWSAILSHREFNRSSSKPRDDRASRSNREPA